MGQYGRPRDVGAYTIMSLESGPFLTMVTLGVAGLSAFPWQTLVGSILPLMVGMLLGNLDREMRDFLSRAIPVMIPFFAFALGTGLDLTKVWQAGLLGLGLGVAVVVVTGIPLFFADQADRRNRRGGRRRGLRPRAMRPPCRRSSPPPIPPMPKRRPPATVLVAACVVVTAILVPLVTAWTARTFGQPAEPDAEAAAETAAAEVSPSPVATPAGH